MADENKWSLKYTFYLVRVEKNNRLIGVAPLYLENNQSLKMSILLINDIDADVRNKIPYNVIHEDVSDTWINIYIA